MRTGLIYKVTNLVNGKVYIGQTSLTLESRQKSHFKELHKKKNDKFVYDTNFARALRKYNFKWEILYNNIPIEKLGIAEMCAVYVHDSFYAGYNMTLGGETSPSLFEEVRRKISKSLTGRKLSKEHAEKSRKGLLDEFGVSIWKGKTRSEETRQKMAIVAQNRSEPSLETRQKMSRSAKGKTVSEETKKKMSENNGKWNKGLTKETSESIRMGAEKISKKLLGRIPWNKGINKDDPRFQKYARAIENHFKNKRIPLEIFEQSAKNNNFKQTKIVTDLGISGASVSRYPKYFGYKTWKEFCIAVKAKELNKIV